MAVMAARFTSRLPLRHPANVCSQQICSRAQTQPQWRPRFAKTKLPGTAARRLTTSAQLKEKKYTETHEWIELSEDGKTGTIGISKFAAKELGDVVFVELPTLELDVNLGDNIGAVESVKSVSDINTPITGKIVAKNDVLQNKPGTINKNPETEGWIARIEVGEQAEGEMGDLMGKEKYDAFTAED